MANPEPFRQVSAERKRGIWVTLALLVAFVTILMAGFVYTMLKPRLLSEAALRANGTFLFERPRDIGAFALVDDNGEAFTPEDLQGKWSLLFFGFTFCPDVCPTTMAQLNNFYTKLKPELAAQTQVVMVSVDPARDSAAKLHEYVRYFNPVFRGVTGEFLALHTFATSLNIPFTKAPGGGENYLVEHSGNIAIINPAGHYVGFFKAPHELDKLLLSYQTVSAR
jgi:protein SCO1/2